MEEKHPLLIGSKEQSLEDICRTDGLQAYILFNTYYVLSLCIPRLSFSDLEVFHLRALVYLLVLFLVSRLLPYLYE